MRTIVSFSIAVTLGLALHQTALAREEEEGHAKARPPAAHAQRGKQSGAATRGDSRNAPGARANAIVQRQQGRSPGAAAAAGQPRDFQRSSPSVAVAAGNPGRGGSVGRAPANISRGWNHQGQYEWNNHHYGWRGNSWVIIDPGYGYGDGGYGYGGGPGGSGSMTAAVQSSLDRQGYNAGPPDGVMGGQTRDAIAGFQAQHGLVQTGQIDPPLLSALGLQ